VSVTAIAHPNIALIKYWGKQAGDGNLPATPSVSITLDDLASTTLIASSPDDGDHIVLNGERAIDPKISACLTMLRADFEIPPVSIDSTNNFPTAAGLASSASGFAALITAIDAFCGLGLGDDDRAVYARRASGSAARSIYGGFASLGPPDWIARPVLPANEWPLKVVIAITDEGRKSVSSSVGMKTSEETSPYYGPWVSSTAEDYEAALAAVAARNFERLADLSESSCLKAVDRATSSHAIRIAPSVTSWASRSQAMQLWVASRSRANASSSTVFGCGSSSTWPRVRSCTGSAMAVASISTITAASPESWQDAALRGLERARETLRGITGIKVIEEKAHVEDGRITEYLVTLQVVFVLEGSEESG